MAGGHAKPGVVDGQVARLAEGLDSIVEWYLALRDGASVRDTTLAQIQRFSSTYDNPHRSTA